MTKTIAFYLLALAPLSAPAVANPLASIAQHERVAARNTEALKDLETLVRLNPDDGGRHIELATAYLHSGRTADAMVTFHQARLLENEMLETRNGDAVWSHEIADRALGHRVQLSSW